MKCSNVWRFILVLSSFFAVPLSASNESELLTPISDFSGDQNIIETLHPMTQINAGAYSAAREMFANLTVKNWADEYTVQGYAKYGPMFLPFSVNVKQSARGSHIFTGTGHISMNFQSNICRYVIKLQIFSYSEGLYIKSMQPNALPNSAPANGCFNGGPLEEYAHSDIYVKR